MTKQGRLCLTCKQARAIAYKDRRNELRRERYRSTQTENKYSGP